MVGFEILGPQRAWYDDQELDLGPGKQRAVLSVLLLHVGRPVSTARIVDAVWAGDPPANGPNVVQKYIAGLRRILEPDRSPRTPAQVLTLTDAGYLLRVPLDAVDAARFERLIRQAQAARADGRVAEAVELLRTALELWRGEPFPGLDTPFFEAARNRFVELRTSALETWSEWGLELGRHQELVAELTRLVVRFPVRERLRYLQMLALYRDGRQAEALAAFRETRSLLRDEYGVEPGEQLQELHRRILRSDPSLTLPTPAPAAVPTEPDAGPEAVAFGRVTARGEAAGGETVRHVTAGGEVAGHPVAEDAAVAGGSEGAGGPGGAGGPEGAGGLEGAGPTVVEARPVYVPERPPFPTGAVPPGGLPVELGPDPGGVWRRDRDHGSPLWVSHVGTVLGALIVLVSFGVLAWLVMAVFAIRRRSWPLALSAVGYLLVSLVFSVTMGSGDPDEPKPFDFVMIVIMAAGWVGGVIHVVLLNRGLRAAMGGGWAGKRHDGERRLRREQARYLLYHYPAARSELRIGRPDLPRRFDDGGLVDLNAVSEQIVLRLPGLADAQWRRVVADRGLRGPYGSMEELVSRCALPLTATEPLREILLFLPPEPVAGMPFDQPAGPVPGQPTGPVSGWSAAVPLPEPSPYARPAVGAPPHAR